MSQGFHIRRIESTEEGYRKEFDIPDESYQTIMQPNSWSDITWNDDMSISIAELGKIEFSWEMGFIHLVFEEDKFTDEIAMKITEEIFENIITATNQPGEFFQSY